MDTSLIITIITSSGIIGIITTALLTKLKKTADSGDALRYGVQALLRHELYSLYREYCQDKKYAPVYVKEDFESMYAQYHSLGKNGVMDAIREEFQKLPSQPSGGDNT